jgi:hypothetical protein
METYRETKEKQLEKTDHIFKQKNMEFQDEHRKKNPDKQLLNCLNTELTILKKEIEKLKDELGIPH